MIRYLLLIVCHLLAGFASADYWFKPIETKIEATSVGTIHRDSKGFLWLGNQRTGLMRYDGYKMVQYLNQANDSSSISNNYITSILEDSSGRLWVGTAKGLNRYNPETDGFTKYYFGQNSSGTPFQNFINQIVESPDSALFVLTKDGLLKYNHQSDNFTIIRVDNVGLNNFTCAAFDMSGALWCGLNHKSGLYRFNENQKNFTHYSDSDENTVEGIKQLLIDNDNRFWFSQDNKGFAEFLPLQSKFNYYSTDPKKGGVSGSPLSKYLSSPVSLLNTLIPP